MSNKRHKKKQILRKDIQIVATTKSSESTQPSADFDIKKSNQWSKVYSDEVSAANARDEKLTGFSNTYNTAAEVRKALQDALSDNKNVIEASRNLYQVNPIYANIMNYLANMFTWQYKVIPHKVYTKSKAQSKKTIPEDDYRQIYHLMLEVIESLHIETKFPSLLLNCVLTGAVYFTTISDDNLLSIDTVILPSQYCRAIGQTQYGTRLIQFNLEYFDNVTTEEDLEQLLKSFPKEIQKGYKAYSKNNKDNWITLDPRFSSAVLMNEYAIPTYWYLLGSILDYEKYQDNELQRNENLLKYIVVHTMPTYQDRLLFSMDEVQDLHKSLRRIVETGDKARLITTFGDVKVAKIAESDKQANETLEKAYQAIFNNASFNSGLFTSETVTGLKQSLLRDRTMIWKYVQELVNFYNIAVNNWYDFKKYQAEIEILPISPYTYNDDIKVYKENATLGISKLDFIIASGTKQKHIEDVFELESFLNLDRIRPLQTSYTQTAEDRKETSADESTTSQDIEPSSNEVDPSNDNSSANTNE